MHTLNLIHHHATLFVHKDRKGVAELFWKELQDDSLAHIFHDHTVFDIETVRDLISWANTPYEGTKTALLSFHTITVPAQNALLKILEEPRVGVRFILVTSNKDALLPTFISRVQEKELQNKEKRQNAAAALFLQTESKMRMKLPYITKLLTKEDEEGRKDRESITMFLLDLLEEAVSKKIEAKKIQEIVEMAAFTSLPSSSGKTILEYLSLLLPQTKD